MAITTVWYLQWGRNLFVAESRFPTDPYCRRGLLQWGRNLFVAESATPGPRTAPRGRTFNGAATCSLRKAGGGKLFYFFYLDLQWGRNLFVAESPFAAHERR